MPTTPTTNRYATMTAYQVTLELARIAARDAEWAANMRTRIAAALAIGAV